MPTYRVPERLCTLGFLFALAACGGGGSDDSTSTAAPAPAPAPAPEPAPAPAPASITYYFSECSTGAHASCVEGDNADSGLAADTPKRNLDGFDVNALPAGARLLFARGGAWADFRIVPLDNRNATSAEPLVFDAYGSGAAPWLKTPSGNAIEFGAWQNTENDGGYVLRNLKFEGGAESWWAIWLRDNVHDVTIENVEITGFDIAIHSQAAAPHGINNVTLRNSHIVENREMGILGQFDDSLFEGNTFERNNVSGSTFSHAIYMSGGDHGGRNNVIRGNRFLRNSVVDGVCTGGNVTFHGQMDGMLIEDNRIEQDSATGGCYGFSITTGYDTPEWFRNFVVRGNTVVNVGHCSYCINAAPGIVVEDNLSYNDQTFYHAAVRIGGEIGAGDTPDADAVVRDNTACFPSNAAHQHGEVVESPGSSVTGSVVFRGADVTAANCPIEAD